jgi:hypothetical protein
MVFEKLFPSSLQNGIREKRKLFKCQRFTVFMFIDGKLAGEIYGMEPQYSPEQIEGCARYEGKQAIYIYSTGILKQFQGLGLSKVLKAYFHGLVFGARYDLIIGHATTPQMLDINKAFGARVVQEFQNWYDTGRKAYLYEIPRP